MRDRCLMTPQTQPFRSANLLWADRVAASGDKLAYRYKQDGAWVDVSWKQADGGAREVAAGLAAIGLRQGDRVCICAQTRFEWMLCDLGVLLAGGASVPIYPSSTQDQSAYIV